MGKYKLEYHSEYDFGSAKLREWYALWEWRDWGIIRKNPKWHRVTERINSEFGSWDSPVSGDLDWAKRVAKHLKIQLPKPHKKES